jgi:hypothetical protein
MHLSIHCQPNEMRFPFNSPDKPTQKVGRPKKLTDEISSSIETLSCMDSTLTNLQIAIMIHQRWATVSLSASSVSPERIRFGFIWRPPLVKQDLSIAQEHQRLQFALDLTSMNLDPAKIIIIFSNESRFVLGDDNHWRHLRKGDWNETAFVPKTKIPVGVTIWGAIVAQDRSRCFFCSNGADSDEYQR